MAPERQPGSIWCWATVLDSYGHDVAIWVVHRLIGMRLGYNIYGLDVRWFMIKYANKSGPMAEHTHFQAHTTVLCLFKSIGRHEAVDSATAVNAVNLL